MVPGTWYTLRRFIRNILLECFAERRQAIDFRSERPSTKTLIYHRQRHYPQPHVAHSLHDSPVQAKPSNKSSSVLLQLRDGSNVEQCKLFLHEIFVIVGVCTRPGRPYKTKSETPVIRKIQKYTKMRTRSTRNERKNAGKPKQDN